MTQYRITVLCKPNKKTTTAEGVKTSFSCPLCGETLVYIPNEHRLGQHGKSDKSLNHELRKVEVLESVSLSV